MKIKSDQYKPEEIGTMNIERGDPCVVYLKDKPRRKRREAKFKEFPYISRVLLSGIESKTDPNYEILKSINNSQSIQLTTREKINSDGYLSADTSGTIVEAWRRVGEEIDRVTSLSSKFNPYYN